MVGHQRADRVARAPVAGMRLLAGQLVKPAARRHPGRDSAEHTWYLALAAYRFAGPGQALETGRVLASLLRHDLGSRPGPAHDHARLAIRPGGIPAAIAMPGQLPKLCGASVPMGFVHAAFACPAAPVQKVPGGPCTGNLREGQAASVPATDADTQSPDPWRPPMPGSHLPIRPGRRTTSVN